MHKGNILVTGGLGYIGSHTVVELINNGFIPIIVDNLNNSIINILHRLRVLTSHHIRFYDIDCCDNRIERIFSREDLLGVIHFAADKSVVESVKQPFKYYENNVQSLNSILRCMHVYDVKNIVFSSSCTVYGQPDNIPVDENTPLKKSESPYGHTKQICEEIIQSTQSLKNMSTVILRYFNPIGAHPSSLIGELPIGIPDNLVPYITQTAIGEREKLTVFGNDYDTPDGTCIRDYIHVCDLARSHIKALEWMVTKDKIIEIFNIGVGKGYSVLELIKAFEKVNNLKLNYEIGKRRQGDIEKIYSKTGKANNVLNWEATC